MNFDVVSAGMALAAGLGAGRTPSTSRFSPVPEPDGETPVVQGGGALPEHPEQTIAERAREEDSAEKSTTERVQEVRSLVQTRLSIHYDEDAEFYVLRRIDKGSGEVVSQYPYETQLARIRFFVEQLNEAREERLDVVV
jgi:uncharacterized FlaG/YvyC family protein